MRKRLLFIMVTSIFLFSCSTKKTNINYSHKLFFKAQLKPKIVPTIKRETKSTEKEKIPKERKKVKQKTNAQKVEIIKVPQFIETEEISISTFLPEVKSQQKIKFPKEDIQISVEDMPLYDFINLVFGKILKLNYVISPDVQNLREKITLNMTSPMRPKEFLQFIIDFLRDYQVDIVYKNDIFYVKRKSRVRKKIAYSDNIVIGREIPQNIPDDLRVTMIIPLYYITKNQFIGIVRLFLLNNNILLDSPLPSSNLTFVSAKVSELKKIEKLVKVFDRPYFAKKEIYLLNIEYLTANELAKELQKVLKPMGIPISDNPKQNTLTMIPLERKNALLLISPKKEWINTAIYWKKQIDTIEAFAEEPQLFLYKPRNRSAESLAQVLEKILIGSSKNLRIKTKQKAKAKKIQKNLNTIKTKAFNISVDKERNSIIVMAYPSDYKKIKRILEKLDTPPKQVLIEVTIAEITLTDQLQFGFEWYLKHTDSNYIGELKTLGGLGIGGAGFNYSLIGTAGKFKMLFNAFAKKNLINIVSTPHLLVLDGKEASINVGTEVPVVSSETTAPDVTNNTGQPSILRNVQYRDTGVILSVKPVITSKDKLNIEITQELSEAQANNISNIDSPLILNRSIKTSLNIKSGQTVLLGGLISENISKSRSKVPFLGDLPLIGHLFSVDSKGKNKTELIILITPFIINNDNDLELIRKSIDYIK